jgi:hypothetical protein
MKNNKSGRKKMSHSVYFLHIPKTGGRLIRNNIFRYLGEQISRDNIDTKDFNIKFSHSGIYLLEEDQYSFSFFRDPVKRTVSHYLFFNAIFKKNFSIENKNTMIDWIENNQKIHNYQSKFLSHYDEELYENFNNIEFLDVNINDVKNNIKKLTRFHKTENINNFLITSIYNEIQDYLDLPKKVLEKPIILLGTEINVASKDMYSLLSDYEKEYIASLNAVDMEIYNTSNLFNS